MKGLLLLLLSAVTFTAAVSAQDIQSKEEAGLLGIGYSEISDSENITEESIALLEQQLIETISGIGILNLRLIDYSLNASEISAFIEDGLMGYSDLSMIIIPSITLYEPIIKEADNGTVWEIELALSVSIISVKTFSVTAQFLINVFGAGTTEKEALLMVSDIIKRQLKYKLQDIDEFMVEYGIIEKLPGDKVVIGMGADDGVVLGDEFSILSFPTPSSEQGVMEKAGLLVVSGVKEDISFAKVIYADNEASIGDQLSVFPKIGIDSSVYGHVFFSENGVPGGRSGIKAAVSRWFYDIRPFAGFEVPFLNGVFKDYLYGFPLSVYLGGEIIWYWRSFQLVPSVSVGSTMIFPLSSTQSFMLTHLGGQAEITLNWLLFDRLRVFIEGGYCYWPSLNTSIEPYSGIFTGLGVTIKM